jgi:hypothetical protein
LLRRGRALCGASFVALVLCGCAFSFEDGDGARHVVGLFSIGDAPQAPASADVAHQFGFYGVWIDDAFRGTAVAVGEVQLTVADLRNQWAERAAAPDDGSDCSTGEGFGLHWCSLGGGRERAGALFDIAVAGLTVGVGTRDKHFGVGYHRQTLVEVTDDNALVAWPALPAFAETSVGDLDNEPAQASVQELLRGSFNG